jgi:molybdopterin molybdotransferase
VRAGADVVLTTGGVSVGEHDHARAALHALGGTLRFWRVRMRPGGPLAAGTLPAPDGRVVPWLGLPGNPVSTMVTFALFARPLLARLLGDARPFPRTIAARLAEPVRAPAALAHYLRATLATADDGALEARLSGPQGSGLLTSMALADALLVVPEAVNALATGDTVRVLPLADGGALHGATPDVGVYGAMVGA